MSKSLKTKPNQLIARLNKASQLIQVSGAYFRAFLITLWLMVVVGLSGCHDNSADKRFRKVLAIPAAISLSEAVVTEYLQKMIPLGTAEAEINEKVSALDVGEDRLSSYTFVPNREMAVLRVEYDSTTFGLVKSQWIITFHLDSSMKLTSMTTKRYLVGL